MESLDAKALFFATNTSCRVEVIIMSNIPEGLRFEAQGKLMWAWRILQYLKADIADFDDELTSKLNDAQKLILEVKHDDKLIPEKMGS